MTEDKKLEKRFEKWLRKYLLCNDCKRKCSCVQLNAYCEEQVKQAYLAGAKENQQAIEKAYLAGAKENQQAIEKAVEIIKELGGIVREGVTCHYLVDYGALYRATLFLKEYAK